MQSSSAKLHFIHDRFLTVNYLTPTTDNSRFHQTVRIIKFTNPAVCGLPKLPLET
ncbi:conserved hypothetical protein [Ricinus communis]|uniref:Uncharacterized protein n=1 Tax=Ricinus communis TaxID=3988 RepID=B9RKS3_RICCO|nr:conserved hypothetical protein [Ricinus communis]